MLSTSAPDQSNSKTYDWIVDLSVPNLIFAGHIFIKSNWAKIVPILLVFEEFWLVD